MSNYQPADEGTVKQVTLARAKDLIEQARWPERRVPRRRMLYEQLDEILGTGGRGDGLSRTIMGSEFSPGPGDKTIICLSASQFAGMVKITVLRTKICARSDDGVEAKKAKAEYHAHSPKAAWFREASQYLLVESTQPGYATIQATTEKRYKSAIKTLERREKAAAA